MASSHLQKFNADDVLIEDDQHETETDAPVTITKVATQKAHSRAAASGEKQPRLAQGVHDEEGHGDPNDWLFREQARLTARYQQMMMEKAQKHVQKTLSFGPTHADQGPSTKKQTPSRHQGEPRPGSRSGGYGRNAHSQDYAPVDEEDGYESTAYAEDDDDLVKPYRPKDLAEKSKFCLRIAMAPIPSRAKLPSSIGKYDGIRDPDDHVHDFKTAACAMNWPMQVWCHLFAQTLTGAARVWFDNLPAGGILNFEDLLAKFSLHFSHQRRHKKDKAHILLCQRRDNESMEDYITRYNREALQIGCGEELTRAGFLQGVHSDELMKCLTGKDGIPESWDEVIKAAKIFAASERSFRQTRHNNNSNNDHSKNKNKQSVWSRISGSADEGKYSSQQDARSFISGKQTREQRGEPSKSHDWTPLIKTPSQVLATEQVNFKEPRPIGKRRNADVSKRCDYHNDYGHTTDNCYALKMEIETALKSGQLSHLVKNVQRGAHGHNDEDRVEDAAKQIRDLQTHLVEHSPRYK